MKRVFFLTLPKLESSLFSIKIHLKIKQNYINFFLGTYIFNLNFARVKLCHKGVSINVSSAIYGVPSQKINKYNVVPLI